eukprot:4230273-Amphidinium_carterae.1
MLRTSDSGTRIKARSNIAKAKQYAIGFALTATWMQGVRTVQPVVQSVPALQSQAIANACLSAECHDRALYAARMVLLHRANRSPQPWSERWV